MARYRLRFLLQEFDLPTGDTLIGRGPDCRITLVDPLVSRHHARVRFEGGKAVFEDLGSRNGSRVNGRLVRGMHVLKHGDRLRIGTQELVFSEVGSVPLAAGDRQQELVCRCAACKAVYSAGLEACPACGAFEVEEDSTLSGILDDRQRQSIALQMLMEMLRKALALGREADAERIMVQAIAAVQERLRPPNMVDPGQLEALGLEAIRLSKLQTTRKWAVSLLELYRRGAQVLTPPLVAALEGLALQDKQGFAVPIEALVAAAPVTRLSGAEVEGLEQLKRLAAKVRER